MRNEVLPDLLFLQGSFDAQATKTHFRLKKYKPFQDANHAREVEDYSVDDSETEEDLNKREKNAHQGTVTYAF